MVPQPLRLRFVLPLLPVLWLHVCGAVLAQEGVTSQQEPERRLAEWNAALGKAEALVAGEEVDEQRLQRLLKQLETLGREIRAARAAAQPEAKALSEQLRALGAPPEPGAPAEDAAVTARRAELEEQLALVEGRIKQAGLASTRAQQLVEKILTRQHTQVAERLLERNRSPLSPAVLKSVGPHLVFVLRQLVEAPLEAWMPLLAGKVDVRTVVGGLVLTLLALALGVPVRRSLLKRYVRDRDLAEPSFGLRVKTAILIGFARGVVPALVVATPLIGILAFPAKRGIVGDTVVAALLGIMFIAFALGLARAALAPYSPAGWRLTPLTDESSRALYRRISLLCVIPAVVFLVEYPARRHLEVPVELGIFYEFLANSVFAVVLLLLLPGRLWQTIEAEPAEGDEQAPPAFRRPALGRPTRMVLAAIALAIPITAVLGYGRLSEYLTTNVFLTGVVLGVLIVFHGLARDVCTLLLDRETGRAATIRATLGATDRNTRILSFWIMVGFDLVLVIVGVLALMPVWGVAWAEVRELVRTATSGIPLGRFTFSITDLLAGILVFVVVLAVSRWIQRVLEERIFPHTSLDIGVRHSLKTITGYVGLTLAVVLGVSALGFDLSSLAIIAGALSVGIGFGLQNIVNNFVSGLILLAERPVKVGDWVVVGEHQGYVKRINVRATEIQTFQRSSVIIPNSDMVSGALVNWTHKDTYARVDISVGVAYGSDTELVRDILLKCANDHPRVNAWPEPFVLFQNFGDSSLDFSLRCFISQADESFRVGSDLRFAIDKAFREANVVIPFPQRDLHVKDADRLAELLADARQGDGAARRARKSTGVESPAPREDRDASD